MLKVEIQLIALSGHNCSKSLLNELEKMPGSVNVTEKIRVLVAYY